MGYSPERKGWDSDVVNLMKTRWIWKIALHRATPEGVTTNVCSDSFRSHLEITPEGVTTNVCSDFLTVRSDSFRSHLPVTPEGVTTNG